MMQGTPSPTCTTRRVAATGVVVLVLVAATLLGGARPAAAAAPDSIGFTGHGWGHGRGMGQWGALGYSRLGWTHDRILDHFYDATTPGAVANDPISVRLEELDDQDLLVEQANSQIGTSATGSLRFAAVRVRHTGTQWSLDTGTSCAGPWTEVAAALDNITVSSAEATTGNVADRSHMLKTCRPNGARWVRGALRPAVVGATTIAVNDLPIEDYLLGVVGSESPASWGDEGAGAAKGSALRAQAVAARSYGRAENRSPGVYQTCATTTCQVYLGMADQTGGGAVVNREDGRVLAAVGATTGQVRMRNNAVARTEFSASSGGRSVPSPNGASVIDDGDATAGNPHHTWRATVARSRIEAMWAPGGAGELTAITVTGRAADTAGARTTNVHLIFTSGTVDVPARSGGNGFFERLYCLCATGLRGDWFTVDATTQSGIAGYRIVGADGGIYAFGSATFLGSTGAMRLNKPVVGMAPTPSGNGYWLVASDGGIFSYGDAGFEGSDPTIGRAVAMAPTTTGHGYLIVTQTGRVGSFGDAPAFGDVPSAAPGVHPPVVGMSTVAVAR